MNKQPRSPKRKASDSDNIAPGKYGPGIQPFGKNVKSGAKMQKPKK